MRCYMRCHYGYIRDEALDWYRHGIDYRKKTCSQRSTTLLFVKSVLTSVFRNKRKSIVQSLMAWQNAGFIPPALAVQWMLKEWETEKKISTDHPWARWSSWCRSALASSSWGWSGPCCPTQSCSASSASPRCRNCQDPGVWDSLTQVEWMVF